MDKINLYAQDFQDILDCYPELRYGYTYTTAGCKVLVLKLTNKDGYDFDIATKSKVLLTWIGEKVPGHSSSSMMHTPDGMAIVFNAAADTVWDLFELR